MVAAVFITGVAFMGVGGNPSADEKRELNRAGSFLSTRLNPDLSDTVQLSSLAQSMMPDKKPAATPSQGPAERSTNIIT